MMASDDEFEENDQESDNENHKDTPDHTDDDSDNDNALDDETKNDTDPDDIAEPRASDDNLSDSNTACDPEIDGDSHTDEENIPGNDEKEASLPDSIVTDNVSRLAKIVPRATGPIETLIVLGNQSFDQGLRHWNTAASMEHSRDLLVESAKMEAADGGKQKKSGSKKESKKKKKGSKKSKKSARKGQIAKPPAVTAAKEPTPQELLAIEARHSTDAKILFKKSLSLYQRARRLCLQSSEGEENEFYLAATINAAECHLRLGDSMQSETLLSPVLAVIDTPFGVAGAAQVASKELLLVVARIWWPALFPPEAKAKKGKRGAKKKGGKKKGSKKKVGKKIGSKKKKK